MGKYIWYSPATDITGQALADALNLTGSRNKPQALRNGDILVGWGTKIKQDINIRADIHVLNHPNKIKLNRNKLAALDQMSGNAQLRTNIAKYCQSNQIMQELHQSTPSRLKLPVVGRTKYHQGGKGFWLCLTKQHVQSAIDDGASYFQNYIDVANEYRLHVAFGAVIYAVKKIENATENGWKNQRKEKIADYAQKNNWNIDDATMDNVLSLLYKEAVLPDRIVRSNRRGWKFSHVRLNTVSDVMKSTAIKAVEVLGLDFGAVDCAVGTDGTPYILEVNSGPGLQGTALEKYVAAFQAKIADIETPKVSTVRKAAAAAKKAISPNSTNKAAPSKGMVKIMQNVKTDEEATAVIQALVAQYKGD